MARFRVFKFYPFLLLLLLPLLLLLLQSTVTAILPPHKNIHGLSQHHKQTLFLRHVDPDPEHHCSHDFKTFYYDQTLDHFNYASQSYAIFKQKYVINSKHWAGPNSTAPILAYLGAEEALDGALGYIGFLNDNAPSFKSLSVYIEHRFYGESQPFGSMKESMKNETTRGFFNSAQALADYAEILLHIKEKLSALNSPIIVVGGSYGGMLASWFRLKYPHIALGALASSAPILYFDNITPQNGYSSIVTKDFKDVSKSCYQTIKKSWAEIEKLAASKPDGLSILSRRFNTCSPLNNSDELKYFLESMYEVAAQYDSPASLVSRVCKGIDGGVPNKTDILGRIFAGIVSYKGNNKCINTSYSSFPSEAVIGWHWQCCSEIVMPIGNGENDTMFSASPFDFTEYASECEELYEVSPRPNWITTYYGGHDIKLVLQRFGSNIIFSNGLRDPYSSGGVLQDLSQTIVAVTTLHGSHCLDIQKANNTDAQWLVAQRNRELEIITGWLTTYYSDLQALKK